MGGSTLHSTSKEPPRITIWRVRQCSKFKNLSDAEVLEVIESLERLSIILIEPYHQNQLENETPQPPQSIRQRKI
jgi:hypothetical protein